MTVSGLQPLYVRGALRTARPTVSLQQTAQLFWRLLGQFGAIGNPTLQECFAMLAISEAHLKMFPLAILQDAHPPISFYRVAELPKDVVAAFIAESFVVGLN